MKGSKPLYNLIHVWIHAIAGPVSSDRDPELETQQAGTSCPPGTASVGGATFCTSCSSGTYAAMNGSTTCTNCPAGSSCLDVTESPAFCGNGTYSHVGDGYCTSCDAGTYSLEGASGCLSCPVGKSCFDPTEEPIACEEGYYSEGGNVSQPPALGVLSYRDPKLGQTV